VWARRESWSADGRGWLLSGILQRDGPVAKSLFLNLQVLEKRRRRAQSRLLLFGAAFFF
jgi:hypothetical protein